MRHCRTPVTSSASLAAKVNSSAAWSSVFFPVATTVTSMTPRRCSVCCTGLHEAAREEARLYCEEIVAED